MSFSLETPEPPTSCLWEEIDHLVHFFNVSQVLIYGLLVTTLSLVFVCHQSFTSLERYIGMIVTYSFVGIWVALKYYSTSQRKFSKSLAFQVPLKGLGSSTRTFVGIGFEVDGMPWNTTNFSTMILSSRDPTHPRKSFTADLIMVIRESIHSSVYLSWLSVSLCCTSSSSMISTTLIDRMEPASQPPPTIFNHVPCSRSASKALLFVVVGFDTNCHTHNSRSQI